MKSTSQTCSPSVVEPFGADAGGDLRLAFLPEVTVKLTQTFLSRETDGYF